MWVKLTGTAYSALHPTAAGGCMGTVTGARLIRFFHSLIYWLISGFGCPRPRLELRTLTKRIIRLKASQSQPAVLLPVYHQPGRDVGRFRRLALITPHA
ncbi:hypothetical protein RRG08_008386 [Elysia crispata]|uniref:Uncharacterized protein n=1 Tax=Elysia crispata TaxID=231223 RepID=A0AAE1B187_9GAST|nr:hypothetical protein RRG08_008386 [Elysia crispata]